MKYETADVCLVSTGEVIYSFTPMEIFMGKQYMTARIIGRFYTIVEIDERYGRLTFYVR